MDQPDDSLSPSVGDSLRSTDIGPPMLQRVTSKGVAGIAWGAGKEWFDRRASSKGAALALYTLLAIAPILILVLAAAGLFVEPATAERALLVQMKSLMGPWGADAVSAVLASAHQQDSGITATTISAIVLFFSATTAFAELKESLDELWEVEPSQSSGLWALVQERILSTGVLLVLALMLLSSLAFSAGLDVASGMLEGSAASFVARAGTSVLVYSFVSAFFAVIFKVLPAAEVDWEDVWIGALVTAALFLLGKAAVEYYVAHTGISSAYGAAGSIVALVAWVYYSAQIFMYGSLFTHLFAVTYGSRLKVSPFASSTNTHR